MAFPKMQSPNSHWCDSYTFFNRTRLAYLTGFDSFGSDEFQRFARVENQPLYFIPQSNCYFIFINHASTVRARNESSRLFLYRTNRRPLHVRNGVEYARIYICVMYAYELIRPIVTLNIVRFEVAIRSGGYFLKKFQRYLRYF